MLTSLNLNAERESHVPETPHRDLCLLQTLKKNLRLKNASRLVWAYLNINSVRNKFNLLTDIIKNNIDILIVLEPVTLFEPHNLQKNLY